MVDLTCGGSWPAVFSQNTWLLDLEIKSSLAEDMGNFESAGGKVMSSHRMKTD